MLAFLGSLLSTMGALFAAMFVVAVLALIAGTGSLLISYGGYILLAAVALWVTVWSMRKLVGKLKK